MRSVEDFDLSFSFYKTDLSSRPKHSNFEGGGMFLRNVVSSLQGHIVSTQLTSICFRKHDNKIFSQLYTNYEHWFSYWISLNSKL